MKRYVTYLPDGTLDGCFMQEPAAEHIGRMIDIDDVISVTWASYRANTARDGVELAPPAPAPQPQVPLQVSRRQARQALLLAGLLDQVPAKIALIEDTTKRGMAQIEWEDSQVFERNRPLLIEIAAAIGLDAAGLDKLFIEAGGL